MTSDLHADLDALADAAEVIAELVGGEHGRALDELATRLRHLLDDRDIDQAPLTSEIIAWLEADPDHIVECWVSDGGKWSACWLSIAHWRDRLTRHDDQRQPGYRLGTRKPATERVRLDQVIERTLPGETTPILDVTNHTCGWQAFTGRRWCILDIDADGTVEVLKVYPT
jgi:hypothetical protein